VSDSTFAGNQAIGASGVTFGDAAAIDVEYSTKATISNCSFTNNTLPDLEQRIALAELVRAQATGRDFTGALATASQMANPDIGTYYYIAGAQAEAGDITGALSTVEGNVRNGWRHRRHLQFIARAQTKQGHAKEALVWARQRTDDMAKGYALLRVAEGLLAKNLGAE
jgi:hypothetical protein